MKKINTHSDHYFVKGFDIWFLFKRIIELNSFEDFFQSKFTKLSDREHLWKIIKTFSYTVIIESFVVDMMYDEFGRFDRQKRDEIHATVISQICKNLNFKKTTKNLLLAEKFLVDQISDSGQIMTTPVLQYLAGYSMGGLISLVRKYFSFDPDILDKIDHFKEDRNYVVHCSTSSRDDIDSKLESCLNLGKELINILDKKPTSNI